MWLNINNNNHLNTNYYLNPNTAIALAIEYLLITEKEKTTVPTHAIKIGWHKPPPHSYKLNIDGAFNDKEKVGGLGGLFRDHNGHWLLGYQHRCPARSLHVELQALKEGFKIALMKGFTPLIVETDATRLRELRIIYNFREGNKVAHKMAKEALKEGTEFQLLDNPPSYVINNLASDRASCVNFVKTMAVSVCAQLAEW
uniref:RNase H type-1 domain-containing protein n=1 Tax=Nicotiana tabacum TaxID=4097 RepID=A0A1S3Y7J9_TOBAC